MTADELATQFYKEFGYRPYPSTYKIDPETYGHVCQAVFDNVIKQKEQFYLNQDEDVAIVSVALGVNNGIMFKNVELILEKK